MKEEEVVGFGAKSQETLTVDALCHDVTVELPKRVCALLYHPKLGFYV